MTPVSTERGGQGENLTGFLESQYKVSYKMVIHFKAVNAIIKASEARKCKSCIL